MNKHYPSDKLFALINTECKAARQAGWDDCIFAVVSTIYDWLHLQPDSARQTQICGWSLMRIAEECERRGYPIPDWVENEGVLS